MKDSLVRFGLAMEPALLAELDAVAEGRGCTRSELIRDLARAEVVRSKVPKNVPAVAALTLVYDHHVRDLSEKLTDLQHDVGEMIRSTMHVHLSHDECLEVIVMDGKSHELKAFADKVLGTRGVKHGAIEIVATMADKSPAKSGAKTAAKTSKKTSAKPHNHPHGH
jgi:CopG family nickel-responsive transcriptional regulator